jgi:hypothetical protein
MKIVGEEMMACQEKMEARLEVEDKPASVDTTPEVAHEQGVQMEDAVIMPVGEPRKRRRDRRHLAAQGRQKKEERNLDARRRGKQQNTVAARRGTTRRAAVARRRRILFIKDTTREFHGSRNNLVAAHRGTTRRAKVARRKENLIRKNLTKDNMVRRAPERRTFGRKYQPTQKDKNGLRSRRLTHHLRNWREYDKTFMKNYEKVTGVGIAKQIAGSPVTLQKNKNWTLWRGRPPPKRKKVHEAEGQPVR